MTIEEKNVAIAEMLGWERGRDERFTNWWFDKDNVRRDSDTYLQFDNDANWQFEAIDWIEKQGYNTNIYFHSGSRIQAFVICDYKGSLICMREGNTLSKKEAIFEVLYQFSQYIKENGSK